MGGLGGECVYLPLAGCLNKTKEKRKREKMIVFSIPHPVYILHLSSSDAGLDDTCVWSPAPDVTIRVYNLGI